MLHNSLLLDPGGGEDSTQEHTGGWQERLGSEIWIDSGYLSVLEKNKWKDEWA